MNAEHDKNRKPWILVTTGIHDRGGQDKANFALAEYLLSEGVPVHLVAHSIDERLTRHPNAIAHIVPHPPGPFFVSERVLDHYGRNVARAVRASHPNARVVVNGGNCLVSGSINWSHYVHGAWPASNRKAPFWYRTKTALDQRRNINRERIAYQQASVVITNSNNTGEHIVKLYGVSSDRVRTIYLGCDSAWGPVEKEERAAARKHFALTSEQPVAVFVGGIGWDDRKGFDLLIDAWTSLGASENWDVPLLVAGNGSALAHWKQQVSASGLEQKIRFLGFVGEVRQLIATADILISPVRYEPYGLNVQEAICRGVPAMVSACAGVAERYVRDPWNRLLVQDLGDSRELIEKLRSWRVAVDYWHSQFAHFSKELHQYRWRDMARLMEAEVEIRPTRPTSATVAAKL